MASVLARTEGQSGRGAQADDERLGSDGGGHRREHGACHGRREHERQAQQFLLQEQKSLLGVGVTCAAAAETVQAADLHLGRQPVGAAALDDRN